MPDAIRDNLEGLSDEMKGEYREGTEDEGLKGKFVLKVNSRDGWGLENVQGLKNTVSTLRGEKGRLENKLKGFGEVTPESLGELNTELEELRKKQGQNNSESVQKQIDARVKEMEEKFARDRKTLEDQLGSRDAMVYNLAVESAAKSFIAKHKGSEELLMPHVEKVAKAEYGEDGKTVNVRLYDPRKPDAGPMVSMKSGSTDPMDLDEYIGSLKDNPSFAGAFKGSDASGTGAARSSGSGGQNQDTSKLSPIEKLRQARNEA